MKRPLCLCSLLLFTVAGLAAAQDKKNDELYAQELAQYDSAVAKAKKKLAEACIELMDTERIYPRYPVRQSHINHQQPKESWDYAMGPEILNSLQQEGWDAAYARYQQDEDNRSQRIDGVMNTAESSDAIPKMVALLSDPGKSFRWRISALGVIAARKPDNQNDLIRPSLADKSPEVRLTALMLLDHMSATKKDVEAVLPFLDDRSDETRFRCREFLMRSFGYIPLPEVKDSDSTASWKAWWEASKGKSEAEILDEGFARCMKVMTHPNHEVRMEALGMLLDHSLELGAGEADGKDSWWSVDRGDESVKSWTQYWNLAKPFDPKSVKLATLAMNVQDLKSESKNARTTALCSIATVMGKDFPLKAQYGIPDLFSKSIADWYQFQQEH